MNQGDEIEWMWTSGSETRSECGKNKRKGIEDTLFEGQKTRGKRPQKNLVDILEFGPWKGQRVGILGEPTISTTTKTKRRVHPGN